MDTKHEQPFFARYLEGQEFPDVKTNIKGGPKFPIETHKYPSDGDEINPPGPPPGPFYPEP